MTAPTMPLSQIALSRVTPRARLECTKTGRWWPIRDTADGHRTARRLGLTDYQMVGLAENTRPAPQPKDHTA